jgi:GT2 family glycosyltransferase
LARLTGIAKFKGLVTMLHPRVYIIILNWNGWRDTIECLESIHRSDYPNYYTVVVDNGSRDDSCERIQAWARGDISVESRYIDSYGDEKPVKVVSYDRAIAENGGIQQIEQELSLLSAGKRLILIQSGENLGFAGGCNVGIRYALAVGGEYVWLLNNDTVVEHAALGRMVNFMENHSDYQGVTGQIRLYENPSKIWNCGGKLTCYGARRYYYNNSQVTEVPQHGFRRISFITGCAAIFRTSLFKKAGLLSELFFFGEEDFELSQRLKRLEYKLACRYDAIIYHKVGSSINNAASGENMAKTYIYYLNRFIDIRYYWPKSLWRMWRFFYFLYIFPLLKLKYGSSWNDLWLLRKALLKDSTNLDRVNKATFEQALRFKFGKGMR